MKIFPITIRMIKYWIVPFVLSFAVYAQEGLLSDSTLKNFPVEDLVRMRKVLSKEREQLIQKQQELRDRGLQVSKEFLGKTKKENSNQDKILIRVAEYYVEEEELNYERRFEQYERQFDEYDRLMKAFEEGRIKKKPEMPPQPQRNYQKAIGIYDLIIRNFPESDLIADAYYNKAYLLEEMEETKAARQIFQTIIDKFPESEYAPEAYMKLAENYFYGEPGDSLKETILKLNKAIQLYKNVLQYKDSPRYDEALYKLGWSYYRLAGEDPNYYTDAIVYFLAAVKDIEKLQQLDPTGEVVRADVKPEALEFIAASFIDPSYFKSGVVNATSYIEKLGNPDYGIKIMENMGDRYAKITKWEEAINAYDELLNMYPDYAYAPRIQKKIADAYIANEEPEKAFQERQALFANYNPRSEWYAQLEQSDFPDRISALDKAYKITEEAYRTNITYLFSKANQRDQNNEDATDLYQQFTELSYEYLQNFPTDENAYEINWALAYVLDTKLNRFKDAFTEYIRVSNDYLKTDHQLDAAVNAINVADTVVQMARMSKDRTPLSAGASLQVQELGEEEKMLAEAYDNFIKLFPNSPQTPSVLAEAGALYYNHRQYALAKKYYKTMVTKFPKAQQKSIGLISLMNSYFFLGQYKDAEIVARKILKTPDMPSEQVEVAKSRIGESIFKNGEKLEQEGKFLEAAREYKRVYEEASEYVNFVDLSLFRSARNFEEAGEWHKAIETYEMLVNNYPDSKHVLAAFNNIAADYKELEDYKNVARTNEKIYERFPGTPEAENALYNASLFYAKAEAWEEAIQANREYIATYPSNPESKDLLFENAKYYLKLDDLANANKIYKEFASMYPNDPLTIEAYYNRGEYYFNQANYDSAKIEFNKAIQRSNEFARVGKDPNLYYAAEANFKLGEILYQEYKAIELSYPQERLRAQLERKRNKLNEVQQTFTQVVSLGSIKSFEAMYKIAEAYELFANSIANQDLPENLSKEQVLVEQDRVFKASVPAYDRAVEEYKNVLENLPVLAEKLDIPLDSSQVEAEEPTEAEVDTSVIVQKEVEEDSSQRVALKWYNRAKQKVSKIQYGVAERASLFINEYLRSENPNTGIRKLIFRDQVIARLVAPQVKTTIESHLKNIRVSEKLGLQNKYVKESKRKVLLARNILAEEYQKLFHETVAVYKESLPVLDDLLERGEGATTPDGMDYYQFQDQYLMQLIFYMNQFSKVTLEQYKSTLIIAEQNQINNDARLTTEEKMFNFGYEAGDLMSQLAQNATKKSENYVEMFDSTQNANYQIAIVFYDDHHFELSDYSQATFELTYGLSKEFEIENIWTQLILARLVELDPATYVEDLPKEEFIVSSDSTWLAMSQYQLGWNTGEYDDSQWQMARTLSVPHDSSSRLFDSLQVDASRIWMRKVIPGEQAQTVDNPLEFEDRTAEEDTAGATEPAAVDTLQTITMDTTDTTSGQIATLSEPDSVVGYFRKKITLNAKPIEGWIAIAGGDDSYQLYLNDVYMDQGGIRGTKINYYTFAEFIQEGENLISVSVTDTDGLPRYGLKYYMVLRLLPTEISSVINSIRRQAKESLDSDKLRDAVILNKNRIIE